MYNLFLALLLLSLVCLPVSLIKPSYFRFLQKGKPTRLKAGFTLLVMVVLSFILFGVTYNPSSSVQASKDYQGAVTKMPSPTVKTQSGTPTPTPTDWIANPKCPLSVDDFDACLRQNYPLDATVRASGVSLFITNNTHFDWTNCNISLSDDSFSMNLFDTFTVTSETTISVGWGRLVDDNGNRFNYLTTQPRGINIYCTVGHEQQGSTYSGF